MIASPNETLAATHDVGGRSKYMGETVDRDDEAPDVFGRRVDALRMLLGKKLKLPTDRFRRGVESIPRAEYEAMQYYERWLHSVIFNLKEQGIVTDADLHVEDDDHDEDAEHEHHAHAGHAQGDTHVIAHDAGHDHGHDHKHVHGHKHDHGHDDHGHDHGDHAHGHSHDPSPRNVRLLEVVVSLLLDKHILTEDELQKQQATTDRGSAENGARMVARAWVDPEYRRLLLQDGTAAAEAMGVSMVGAPPLGVLENTESVHHLIVCTLCSCYPRMLLGYPPGWYKSSEYRARAVREPRNLLQDWGIDLPTSVEIRVVDSTADYRWMVLPRRPEGTEGFSEDALRELVNRDALVGADVLTLPSAAPT